MRKKENSKQRNTNRLSIFIEKSNELFKVKHFKYIFKLTLPIFFQTLFVALVSVVSSLASSHYIKVYHADGSYNGFYFYMIAKILTVYKMITFIPIIYQSGTLVLCSNLFGQSKIRDIPKALWSAVYVSLIINTCVYFIMFGLAPIVLQASGTKNIPLFGWKNKEGVDLFKSNIELLKNHNITINDLARMNQFNKVLYGGTINGITLVNTNPFKVLVTSETTMAIKFLRITTCDIFIYSIAVIFTASLQSVEKNKFSIFGLITSIFVRASWTYLIMFLPWKISNEDLFIMVALEPILGAIFHLTIDYSISYHFITKNNKISIKETWNTKYVKNILKLGLPIAFETGIWFIGQYLLARAIPMGFEGKNEQFIGLWRAVNSSYDIFNAVMIALGYVSSAIVANEIGKQNFEAAHELGNSALKFGFYAQSLFSILGVSLTWPLLRLYSIDIQIINSVGYGVMGIMMLRAILDIGNLTTLRALWGANDVWMPNLVSLITMLGVQLSAVYLVVYIQLGHHYFSPATFMFLMTGATLLDAFTRTLLFNIRWSTRKWYKYAKKL